MYRNIYFSRINLSLSHLVSLYILSMCTKTPATRVIVSLANTQETAAVRDHVKYTSWNILIFTLTAIIQYGCS